jgi:hypothetical protein
MKRTRGRPVLGAICGLLLGVFLTLDLHMLHVWSLGKASETVLPIAGLVVGLGLGLLGPLRRRSAGGSPSTPPAPPEQPRTGG